MKVVNKSAGRPSLPVEVCRSKRVVTFLTPNECATVKAMARQEDKSLSKMCHELIIKGIEFDRLY